MGEITRTNAADIVPFNPNDATQVSAELTNIVDNGVNDNFKGTTPNDTTYSGANQPNISENATRLDELYDASGPASGLVQDNIDDIADNVTALGLLDGRVEQNEDDIADLQNATGAEIDATSYALVTGAEKNLHVVYAGNVDIDAGDADDFEAGETFVFTCNDDAANRDYCNIVLDGVQGDFTSNTIYLCSFDILTITAVSYDGGTSKTWVTRMDTTQPERITWKPLAGTTAITVPLYPQRVHMIHADNVATDVTIVMPPLLYMLDRGYSWNLWLESSLNGDVIIKEDALDGGATIKTITGSAGHFFGSIHAETSTAWLIVGTETS